MLYSSEKSFFSEESVNSQGSHWDGWVPVSPQNLLPATITFITMWETWRVCQVPIGETERIKAQPNT